MMEPIALVVNLDEQELSAEWQTKLSQAVPGMTFKLSACEEVDALLCSGQVVLLVIIAEQAKAGVFNLLEAFKRQVGAIPDFQLIVSDSPDPHYLTKVFDYGIEAFASHANWVQKAADVAQKALDTLHDATASETLTIQLNRSILSGDQKKILEAKDRFADTDRYDYLAAFSKGTALQALGRFNEAVEAFRKSEGLNRHFRPATSSLGENLLVLGETDKAIAIFERMEKLNQYSVSRKVNLALAWLEKGDQAKSSQYLQSAEELDPKNPRILEAKAQALLVSGKVGEAFKLMDQLSDVGPFFAAKLNEMGIRLSQKGQGKNALALYKKAHTIVRPELRYKISLNAALACYRMREFSMAMKYIQRCEREYGQSYEKAVKIKDAIEAAMRKQAELGKVAI